MPRDRPTPHTDLRETTAQHPAGGDPTGAAPPASKDTLQATSSLPPPVAGRPFPSTESHTIPLATHTELRESFSGLDGPAAVAALAMAHSPPDLPDVVSEARAAAQQHQHQLGQSDAAYSS